MFRRNLPSSGVQILVIKDSTAHCNAVLFLFRGCLQVDLLVWVNHLLVMVSVSNITNSSDFPNKSEGYRSLLFSVAVKLSFLLHECMCLHVYNTFSIKV
jgi:hypothetical protein